MRPMNGIKIVKRNRAMFVPLPKELQSEISWGCDCSFCKSHPDRIPMWDTMGVSPDFDSTWVVHYPEIHDY